MSRKVTLGEVPVLAQDHEPLGYVPKVEGEEDQDPRRKKEIGGSYGVKFSLTLIYTTPSSFCRAVYTFS